MACVPCRGKGGAWALPLVGMDFILPMTTSVDCENLVGYGGSFEGRTHVVCADDVGSGEDGGYVGGGGGVNQVLR